MPDTVNVQNKEYIPSDQEYQTLRSEILTRTTLISSQSSTAIATIISSWVAGISLLGLALKEGINPNSLITMCYLASIVFLIPIFYFVPLAVKSGENMQQIIAISTYIRVFHEYPTMKKRRDLKNWEITNSLINPITSGHGKRSRNAYIYNVEYTVLSCISLALYIICAFLTYSHIVEIKDVALYTLSWYRSINIVVFLILGILGLLCILKIRKVSSTKEAVINQTNMYIITYLERSKDLGLIESDEVESAKKYLLLDNS